MSVVLTGLVVLPVVLCRLCCAGCVLSAGLITVADGCAVLVMLVELGSFCCVDCAVLCWLCWLCCAGCAVLVALC